MHRVYAVPISVKGIAEFKTLDATEINDLNMPEFYKQAIGQVV